MELNLRNGLRKYNGEPKEVWYVWKELKKIPYRKS